MSRARWTGRAPVAIIVALCLLLYTGHALLRYASYHSTAYDLGFFDQLTANLGSGRGWSSSFLDYDFRGQHWEPILLVWAQLYRIVASPVWLLVVNSVALALAPLAAWRLARAWFGTGSLVAPVAAVAAACSPLVLRTAGFDYHSEALTPVLALLALEAASRRRWLALAACCGVLVLLKEDAFLVVAGIGWLVWRAEGRRAGLALTAAALAGFVLVVGVLMPAFRGNRGGDLLERYAYLGSGGHAASPLDIAGGMLSHPLTWLNHLAATASLQGLAAALLPLALLPLFSGWALLAVLPALAVALLSNDSLQSALQLHYGAEVFPLLLACALLGWRRVEAMAARRALRFPAPGALFAAAGIIAAMVLVADLPGRVADASGLDHGADARQVLNRVPAGVAVAASTDLLPHLSERPVITEVPDIRGANWVVVDTARAPTLQALAAGYRSTLDNLPHEFHLVATAGSVSLWRRS